MPFDCPELWSYDPSTWQNPDLQETNEGNAPSDSPPSCQVFPEVVPINPEPVGALSPVTVQHLSPQDSQSFSHMPLPMDSSPSFAEESLSEQEGRATPPFILPPSALKDRE